MDELRERPPVLGPERPPRTILAGSLTSVERPTQPDPFDSIEMLRALHASGPHSDHARAMDTYGRLIGEWEIEDVHFHRDGTARDRRLGEWLFGWVLQGRAIQDVILSPPRTETADTGERYEYGTTIRLYDDSIDAWHVTFVAPVAGAVVQLLARREGDDIVQTATAPDGKLLRWVFSEISDTGFVWRGYESTDGGDSWFMEEEITARRRNR